MFIFGDSYSTVSWAPTTAPNPTPASPIGVEWPGVTSVGAFQPNWVGYMTNGFNQSNLMAYDYAIAGNNITGYTSQIQTEFIPTAGQKTADIPWTPDNSIFISWIGINDLASWQQQNLYTLGARNFIFVNVPPWDRSPLGTTFPGLGERILNWNGQLTTSALAFSNQNTDASTLVFSSWDTFNTLLNDPSHYNLTSPNTVGGDIWKDDLHPTSAVHYRIANDLAGWLVSLPAGASNPTAISVATTASATTTATTTARPVATVIVGLSETITIHLPRPNSRAAAVLSYQSDGSSSSPSIRQMNISWTYLGLAIGLSVYVFI
ncbi:unnamed protein product [Rhizoctonia solani]|uniref:Carbohydrate esterase family 16 protein n=1 Tax=Rhizoctonia solani TaxID=456999 RepID=A0A8H3BJZ6_9AGAM|nr:unnamed protein product [Rhizoctonia solani]